MREGIPVLKPPQKRDSFLIKGKKIEIEINKKRNVHKNCVRYAPKTTKIL